MKILQRVFVIIGLTVLFVVYSLLPLSELSDGLGSSVALKFDTPDEMINYTFALNFSDRTTLYYIDLTNVYLSEPIVFPRWARPQDGFMYPGTFWGLIVIFGIIAKVVGIAVIPFLTPLAALGCIGLMYGIVKRILGRDAARWSALVLALFPVFVYYASRTMFHSILFIFFWMLGVWLYLKAFITHPTPPLTLRGGILPNAPFLKVREGWGELCGSAMYYLSSLSFGLALFVRFADVVFVVLTITALMYWKRADLKRVFLFFCFFVLSLVPVFILNYVSYGNPLDFGYNGGFVVGNEETPPLFLPLVKGEIKEGVSSLFQSFVSFVLPFGFHPRSMWNIVWNVLLKSYWYYWLLGLLGYVLTIKIYWKSHKKHFMLCSCYVLCVTCYMISLYGSWSFSDSVVPNTFPISSSYYRYFLPLFILAIPFVGYFISLILNWFRRIGLSPYTLYPIPYTLFCVLLFFCFQYAYLGTEGLLHARRQALSYRHVALESVKKTNQEDIILVKRGEDKMVYPDRYHVVNVDYIPRETVERVLKSFKGVVWKIRNGKFVKIER